MSDNKISDSEWEFISEIIEEISIADEEKAIELHDILAEFIAEKINESWLSKPEHFAYAKFSPRERMIKQ